MCLHYKQLNIIFVYLGEMHSYYTKSYFIKDFLKLFLKIFFVFQKLSLTLWCAYHISTLKATKSLTQ